MAKRDEETTEDITRSCGKCRRREPAKNTDLKKRTGDRHSKRKKHLEKYKQAWGHGFAVPPSPPLDSSNGDLLLPVCVALAGGQSYTSFNNNIYLKEGKALYSAFFASLCGRKRQGYSARTPEGLRTYSARTPQVLRKYSMKLAHSAPGIEPLSRR